MKCFKQARLPSNLTRFITQSKPPAKDCMLTMLWWIHK